MGSTKLALILLVCMNIAYVNCCGRRRKRMACCETARLHGDRNFKEELIHFCEERFTHIDIETAASLVSPQNCNTLDWMGYIVQRCTDNMKLDAHEKTTRCCYRNGRMKRRISKKQFSRCVGLNPYHYPGGNRKLYGRKFDRRGYTGLSDLRITDNDFNGIYRYVGARNCEDAAREVENLIERMNNIARYNY